MYPSVSPVVKNLLILNIAIFVATLLLMPQNRMIFAMHYPTATTFMPMQIITHMFMHFDIGHLFGNMIGLFFFGSMLEFVWGPKRFLQYYLICGFGALVLHLAYWYYYFNFSENAAYIDNISQFSMMGASGCVYGLAIGFGLLFPENPISLFPFPVTFPAKWIVPAYLAMSVFGGFNMTPGDSSIAHFAHLGGALTGMVMILIWKKF